jgi:hypothetical protein
VRATGRVCAIGVQGQGDAKDGSLTLHDGGVCHKNDGEEVGARLIGPGLKHVGVEIHGKGGKATQHNGNNEVCVGVVAVVRGVGEMLPSRFEINKNVEVREKFAAVMPQKRGMVGAYKKAKIVGEVAVLRGVGGEYKKPAVIVEARLSNEDKMQVD